MEIFFWGNATLKSPECPTSYKVHQPWPRPGLLGITPSCWVNFMEIIAFQLWFCMHSLNPIEPSNSVKPWSAAAVAEWTTYLCNWGARAEIGLKIEFCSLHIWALSWDGGTEGNFRNVVMNCCRASHPLTWQTVSGTSLKCMAPQVHWEKTFSARFV